MINAARFPQAGSDGIVAPTASAKNDATAASASVTPTHSSMPTSAPTKGPKAVSTYA